MPRTARSIIPNTPYHVIHRGNNRQKIFFAKNDYRRFLSLVVEAKEKYYCKIYTYVLMPNHIHFLLESSDQPENLAKFMKSIAQKYAQYINASHKRTGTLWEGRFKSSPVSSDSYLLACSRYIELNPVRAKLVSDPGIYKWSGYGFKIGQIDNYALLDTDSAYADMGHDDRQRQSNYKKWTMESIPDGEWDNIRKAVNKGVVFGNEHFKEKLEKLLGRRLDAREKGRPVKH